MIVNNEQCKISARTFSHVKSKQSYNKRDVRLFWQLLQVRFWASSKKVMSRKLFSCGPLTVITLLLSAVITHHHIVVPETKTGQTIPSSHESSGNGIVTDTTDHLRGHLRKLGEQSPIILGGVEDIDYVPNGLDFYIHFLRKSQPLVMRGAANDWSALKFWINETYMREKYGHIAFDVEFTKHYERIHPIKKTMNLNEYLDIYKTQQVYLDCPFPHSDLTSDIMIPYCIQCEEVMSTITSVHLLYSSGNTSSSLHNDGYQNLLAIISGFKEVLLASSDKAEYLYANNYTTVPGLSPVNPESVDLKTFPNVSKVSFYKVSERCADIFQSVCKLFTLGYMKHSDEQSFACAISCFANMQNFN